MLKYVLGCVGLLRLQKASRQDDVVDTIRQEYNLLVCSGVTLAIGATSAIGTIGTILPGWARCTHRSLTGCNEDGRTRDEREGRAIQQR